jgi:hypothetical protein
MLVLRPISWRLAFDVEEGHDSRDLLESFLLHGTQRCITFSKLVAPEFVPKQTNISTPTVGIYRYEILINTFYLRKKNNVKIRGKKYTANVPHYHPTMLTPG